MPSLAQELAYVGQAAHQFDVPFPVLWGIFGKESDFGRNVKTNSKGYTGPFQFGVKEAAQYNYPWTNTPNDAEFKQQAFAAAHLLSDRIKATGSVDAGVKSYSGGGYGEADALAKAKDSPKGSGIGPNTEVDPAAAVGAVTGAAKDVAGVIADFFTLVTSLDFWLRLGEGIAGLILIAMGLKTLTGISIPLPPVVPI